MDGAVIIHRRGGIIQEGSGNGIPFVLAGSIIVEPPEDGIAVESVAAPVDAPIQEGSGYGIPLIVK